MSDRTEALLTDNQARDNVTDAELGLDENGKFLGLRVRTKANLGAYYATDRLAFPAITHIGLIRSLHNRCDPRRSDAPAHQHQSDGTLSGSRPAEAAYVLERMVDLAAQEMGIDRIELRRRNYISANALPYKTGFMYTYDSGKFEENMDLCMEKADFAGFEARRADASLGVN